MMEQREEEGRRSRGKGEEKRKERKVKEKIKRENDKKNLCLVFCLKYFLFKNILK
jgi:hypothetical protein